jgi:hypothetical protein
MDKSIAPEQIASAIFIVRGQRVLQDSELAALYGVSTKRFNEQVRRNRKRFPADFMFQLTAEETSSLRSQIATLKTSRGQHRKYSPYVEETSSLASIRAALRAYVRFRVGQTVSNSRSDRCHQDAFT